MHQGAATLKPILNVKDLVVDFPGKKYDSRIISGLNLFLNRGETLGIVGQSGSGKSVFARTLVRLESPGKIISGSIILDDHELANGDRHKINGFRGRKISLVLQDPGSSMDPVFTMGRQFRELLSIHSNSDEIPKNGAAQNKKIFELLQDVSIASPEERCRQYPHQWSRGMLQRAQLQMAFSTRPEVVIMDEITSALDPTITMQVLRLVSDYKKQQGTSIIFITHDLSVAMEICDRIAVMQKGRIVETGKASEIIDNPSHPYTRQLISGIFPKTGRVFVNSKDTLLSTKNLSVKFSFGSGNFLSRRSFYAVKNVNLDIGRKEIFCLIGESGSGKTTLMNGILGFCPYQEGEIIFDKQTAGCPGDTIHQRLKKQSQVVFQNPISSLNPYLSLKQSIIEPLLARGISKKESKKKAYRLAAETGLPDFILEQKPGKVSVGQNQRVCIARALSTEPDILFLDEPLSALDAVNRKDIADLLFRLKESHGLTCFLISHDLGLVRNIGTTVAVMYLGRIVEKSPVKDFFSGACHPYSQALLTNALSHEFHEKNRIIIKGDIPSPHNPPPGCVFHPRCPKRLPICKTKIPSIRKINEHHEVFCHLYQPDPMGHF